ncbi:protein of unknown function [Methylorubrum extorquens]|uniref:Uncharacterized protein n=1 Tax=Methylorubrum extorquens TaxID=408 RepID=A0A2N9AH15_METEX|nr:protein of unknown function [Methylorubrum extorquens]
MDDAKLEWEQAGPLVRRSDT